MTLASLKKPMIGDRVGITRLIRLLDRSKTNIQRKAFLCPHVN